MENLSSEKAKLQSITGYYETKKRQTELKKIEHKMFWQMEKGVVYGEKVCILMGR